MASARSYMGFLFSMRGQDGPVGDLARDAFADADWSGTQHDLKLKTEGTFAQDAFDRSVREYRRWVGTFKKIVKEEKEMKEKTETKTETHTN